MGVVNLEEFSQSPAPAVPTAPPAPAPGSAAGAAPGDALREAFERGYRSGWDDAQDTQRKEAAALTAELSRNLSDISFSFHEAREDVLAGMARFYEALFSEFLPSLADTALKAALVDALVSAATDAAPNRAVIAVAPPDVGPVREVLPTDIALDLSVEPEPALRPGQAYLTFAGGEIEFDFAAVTDRLAACIPATADDGAAEA
ncbi:MAG: hypothetical protein AAGJ74_03400 [Pseudomonadota bacterium]